MPVLPLIDALLLVGWSSIFGGFLLKAIYLTTSFRPTFFGMRPTDFITVAGLALLFALALAARTWVKAHEPELLARRRRVRLAEAGYDAEDIPPLPRSQVADEAARRSAAGY